MKINTLTLNNFRAFPGPESQTFTLDGKNLLVYGENGAGKSSVFHALKMFFTLKHPNPMGETHNVFSEATDHWDGLEHWIEVEFDDGHIIRWTGPPIAGEWTNNTRVVGAAARRGCLDYRALLDTNYAHGEDAINLFDIAIGPLLGDYSVAVGGGTKTIAELWEACSAPFWKDAKREFPARRTSRVLKLVLAAVSAFNAGFRYALTEIKPRVVTLLKELPAEGMMLDDLKFDAVTYNRDLRCFKGTELTPVTSLREHPIARPQHFLNEARLSALGLAIYLAGRLTSVPTGGSELKLLVMDDVLIGMDLSNRLPLLDLLRERFADWQIVLLTHDKTWFDMAKEHVDSNDTWTFIKMYEGGFDGPFSVPVVVEEKQSIREVALNKAAAFATTGEYQAAANYARSAFEGALQRYCKKCSVPIPFEPDLKDLKTEHFLTAIDAWIMKEEKQVFYAAVLERTRLFRRIILNPLSHADVLAVKYEVNGAIAAITKLDVALGQPLPQHAKLLKITRDTATNPLPANQEEAEFDLQIALANIRAKFAWSLRKFCERHQVEVPFTIERPGIIELWNCIHSKAATLFTGSFAALGTKINTEREWLVEEIDRAKLQSLTQADLQRLIALLNPNSDEKTELDVI